MLSQLIIRAAAVFAVTTAFSVFLFAVIRLVMNTLYEKVLCRWNYLAAKLDKLKGYSHPFINRHRILGLFLYVAIPVPGTGVVSGTILSWFLGLDWYTSFLAIIPASAVSNIITTAGITGLLYLASL